MNQENVVEIEKLKREILWLEDTNRHVHGLKDDMMYERDNAIRELKEEKAKLTELSQRYCDLEKGEKKLQQEMYYHDQICTENKKLHKVIDKLEATERKNNILIRNHEDTQWRLKERIRKLQQIEEENKKMKYQVRQFEAMDRQCENMRKRMRKCDEIEDENIELQCKLRDLLGASAAKQLKKNGGANCGELCFEARDGGRGAGERSAGGDCQE